MGPSLLWWLGHAAQSLISSELLLFITHGHMRQAGVATLRPPPCGNRTPLTYMAITFTMMSAHPHDLGPHQKPGLHASVRVPSWKRKGITPCHACRTDAGQLRKAVTEGHSVVLLRGRAPDRSCSSLPGAEQCLVHVLLTCCQARAHAQ